MIFILLIFIQLALFFWLNNVWYKTKETSEVLVYQGVILCFLTFFSWVLLKLEINYSWPILLIFIAFLLKPNFRTEGAIKPLLVTGGLYIITKGSWLVQSYLMYNSNLPVHLFNVDTPYTLNLIQSVFNADEVPFQFIENFSAFSEYHFGSHMLVASWMRAIGGYTWNTFIFWVLFFGFLLIAAVYALLQEFTKLRGVKLIMVFVLLFVGATQPLYNYFNPSTLKNILFNNGGFPLFQNVMGSFLAIGIMFMLLKGKEDIKQLIVASMCVMITPFFKVPYLPIVAMGYGLVMVYYFIQTKNKKLLVLLISTALISGFSLYQFIPKIGMETDISFGYASLMSRHDWFTLLIWLVPVFLLIGWRRKINTRQIIALSFSVPMFILVLTVDINDENAWQLYSLAPFFAMFTFIVFLSDELYWSKIERFKYVLLLPVLFIFIKHFSNEISYSINVYKTPEIGHEYANVSYMNSVLRTIPKNETVLAITDMRYPAENYKRDNRPFHLALSGHQCYNANVTYMTLPEYREECIAWVNEINTNSNLEHVEKVILKYKISHILNVDENSDNLRADYNYKTPLSEKVNVNIIKRGL